MTSRNIKFDQPITSKNKLFWERNKLNNSVLIQTLVKFWLPTSGMFLPQNENASKIETDEKLLRAIQYKTKAKLWRLHEILILEYEIGNSG